MGAEFGVTTWSVAEMNSANPRGNTINICESRGMFLPRLDETTGSNGDSAYVPKGGSMGNSIGVPSHPGGYSFTTTSYSIDPSISYYNYYYWAWSGLNTLKVNYSGYINVRCVR